MQNANFPEVVFYIILLSFLVSGLLARKLEFAKVLKYSIYWLLVALALIFLYSYRFDFLALKNRVLGELQPTKAIIHNDRIIVNIANDGHFYIDAKINNKSVRFIVDTGASDIVLSLYDAKKVGINLEELNFNKFYQTANGKVRGASVALNNFTISGIDFYNINASVNQAEMSVSLLGMSFLRQFARYEFYEDRLILSVTGK